MRESVQPAMLAVEEPIVFVQNLKLLGVRNEKRISRDGSSGGTRSVPDVAMVADRVEVVDSHYDYATKTIIGGRHGASSGTSASAPLWGAYMALVNERRSSAGLGPIGYINDFLQAIKSQPSIYAATFNDIVTGTSYACGRDTCESLNLDGTTYAKGDPVYSAGPGQDLVTGLGTPKCALLQQLASPDPTTCTPSQTDPQNCGTCRHDCLGGACVAGVCQPVVLTDYMASMGEYDVDANFIYWTNDHAVKKMSLDGGAISVLTSEESFAREMTINGDSVFWFDPMLQIIRRQRFIDASPTTIAPLAKFAYYLAANDTRLYWMDGLGRQINTVLLADNTVSTLVNTAGYPDQIQIDSMFLFWSEYTPTTGAKFMRLPLAGGTPSEIVSVPEETVPIHFEFDVDGSYLYWIEDTRALKRVPIGGGTPTVLATFPATTSLYGLTVSGDVYVGVCDSLIAPSCSVIVKVPLAGGTPVTVLSSPAETVGKLRARGAALYYVGYDGSAPPLGRILRLAK